VTVPGSPRIVIHPYDERWAADFSTLRGLLQNGLGDVAIRIDHIGSTSVPGLAVRDTIDIQVSVADLHVREIGRLNQRYPVLFRDYLRHSATAAAAYAQIKTALARSHADDVAAYYDVKDPVCDLIMNAAQRWAADVAWSP